jgi:CSLREA domain-containing protein/MYXO-CTERM domain-containing protein
MMIRRTLLSAIVLGCMAPAYAVTIDVTTFSDENGENTAACSLREAIQASNLSAPYGGCIAGKRDVPSTIQLKAGQYVLTRGELAPNVSVGMSIVGALRTDTTKRDAVTGVYPALLPIKTTITAAANARIFNTSITRADFSLSALMLEGGTAVNGGAIRAGANVSLNQVGVRNATATGSGGAIYLDGTGSDLTVKDSLFEGNQAGSGAAVLGMSCLDPLTLTKRSLMFERSSIVDNGSTSNQSIVDVCGIPTVDFSGVTLSKNTTSSASDAAVLRMRDTSNGNRMSANSKITLLGLTMVENNSPSVMLYDDQVQLVLLNGVLAFNSGFNCRYMGNKLINDIDNVGIASTLIGGTSASETCQIAPLPSSTTNTNKYTGTAVLSDVLHGLADYGSYLKGYLPKMSASAAVTIVDAGASVSSCGSTDQRGVSRSSGFKNTLTNNSLSPRCDMGAVELSQLTANDDDPKANESYAATLKRKITDLTASERAKLSAEDQATLKRLEADLAEYQTEFKKVFKYRTTYVPVWDNDIPYEYWTGAASGTTLQSSIVPLLGANYNVDLESLGTGTEVTATSGNLTASANADQILCTWSPVLRSVGVFRRQFDRTPIGLVDRCKYTIKSKVDNSVVSTGVVQATISNIAPIAEDDEYVLPYGTKTLTLNLLANDSDEGDGPQGVPLDNNGKPLAGYSQFYDGRTSAGLQPLNIRLVEKPTQGVLKFEYEGYCPDNSAGQVENFCYGGKVTYTSNNLFSTFNDSFTYLVLDNELLSSNVAKVTITNTATTTEDTRNGGGSMGVLGLLGLMGVAAYRRRIKRVG